jgi:hypothetical protein
MMSDEVSRKDLRFSPDFAGRVLREADRIAARREYLVRASVLATALAVTGVFGAWRMVGSQAPTPAAPSMVAASAQTMSRAVAESAQTEPLDYMFPEATPLAQFSDQYSAAIAGGAAARRNMLFGGEDAE